MASTSIQRLWAEWLFDGEQWMAGVGVDVDAAGRILTIASGKPDGDAGNHACIIPGLVNAHVHLDLPRLPGRPEGGFVDWIRAVIRERSRLESEVREELVIANLQALLDGGCTCVADVDASGLCEGALSILGVEGRAYRELIGFDLLPEAARALIESPSISEAAGLSPHAPYSVSRALFEAAAASGRPLMIHCSETVEELELLQSGTGPFRELLEELGRWDGSFQAPACSPIAWLERLACLGPRTMLIHVQELVYGDLEILKRTETPVVLCPGTVEYFGREAPQVVEMWDAGLILALGTDSLASNDELDLFGEMHRLHRMASGLDPERILRMATGMGGRAMGLVHAGRLVAGAPFDALCFRDAPQGGPGALSEWICGARPRPDARFLAGRDGCKGELGGNPGL